MPELRIALTITSETALSVGAAGSAGTLADKLVIRDGAGRPVIPGSQLKGKLRFAAEQLLRSLGHTIPSPFDDSPNVEQSNPVRTLFGSPEHASPLRFADLTSTSAADLARSLGATSIRPSVTINRRHGTAEDQRLLLREVTREGLAFHNPEAITGQLEQPADAALLWAALRLCDRWGGAKTRGLGWCEIATTIYWDGTELLPTELGRAFRTLGRAL